LSLEKTMTRNHQDGLLKYNLYKRLLIKFIKWNLLLLFLQ